MKRFLSWLSRNVSVIILLFVIGIFGLVIYAYTYPFQVSEIRKVSILNQVQSGSTISYNVEFCRYTPKGTRINTRRFLVPENKDLNAIELSSNPSLETLDGDKGCRTTAKPVTLTVDVATPPGKYRLLIQSEYCIFIGRCIPVEGRSDIFDVLEPSVEDKLSIISQQLEDIRKSVGGSVGNIIIPPSPIDVTTPRTGHIQNDETVQPPAQTEVEIAPSKPGVIESTVDSLINTVDTLLSQARRIL